MNNKNRVLEYFYNNRENGVSIPVLRRKLDLKEEETDQILEELWDSKAIENAGMIRYRYVPFLSVTEAAYIPLEDRNFPAFAQRKDGLDQLLANLIGNFVDPAKLTHFQPLIEEIRSNIAKRDRDSGDPEEEENFDLYSISCDLIELIT